MHNGTKFDVSQANGLQTITDRNGNVITFSYNGNGGCTSIDSQDGRSIVINRSGANGAISSIKDLNDNLAHYSTDGFGNLANYTDRVGNTTTFDYDYQHNLIGIKNPIGIMPIRNYYYPDGRLNYTLDAQGHEIDQYYDPSIEAGGRVPPVGSPIRTVPGNAQITTDALGNLTLFSYDSYGNVTQRTQYLTDSTHDNTPLTWLCVYNTGDSYNPDRPIQDVDPLGNVTDFTYDTLGDILSTTRYLVSSDGTKIKVITSATYDAQGQVLTQTDALGTVITTNTYNLDGNLDTTKDALGNTTKFSYNSDGSLKRTIDPLGNSSTFSYDQNSPPGNITSVTDANGHVTNFIYDANNNKIARITTRTSAAGDTETVAWRWLFDESDRLIQTIYPDGTTCRTYYNALGKVDHTIDAAGRITTNTYDDEARLIKTRLPDGTFIATVYDADSRGYITTDRASRGTQSVYDTIGRVIATYPLDQNGNRLPDGNGSYIHSKGLCRVSYQKSYFG